MTELLENGLRYIILLALLVNIIVYTKSPTKNNRNLLFLLILQICIFWSTPIFENSLYFPLIKTIRTFILFPLQFIIWIVLIKHNLVNKKLIKILNILIGIYIIFICAIFIVVNFKLNVILPLSYFSYLYIYGVLVLTVTCLLYLSQVSNSKEAMHIWTNQLFYICFALLFLYLGGMPMQILKTPLVKNHMSLFKTLVLINGIFQYILYLTIIATFILLKLKPKANPMPNLWKLKKN